MLEVMSLSQLLQVHAYDMVLCVTGKKYQGVAVIVTVPLGCLKTGDIGFKPTLPAWKQDAIEKLGFGNLNKVQHPWAFLLISACITSLHGPCH